LHQVGELLALRATVSSPQGVEKPAIECDFRPTYPGGADDF
jgi:hypothetical protein